MNKRKKETNLEHLQGMMEVYLVGESSLQDFIFAAHEKYMTWEEINALDDRATRLIEKQILKADEAVLKGNARVWQSKTAQQSSAELLEMFS